MPLINEITPIGAAYPQEKYPNPVKLKRSIIIGLTRIENAHADDQDPNDFMYNQDEVIGALADNPEAVEWLMKDENWTEYKRGLDGAGFEVKRFRMALYFTAGEEETVLVLQEDEDAVALTKCATDMIRTYHSHGYVTKKEADKSTGVYMDILAPNGQREQKQYCRLKVSVIRPADHTPAKEIRYPSPSDIERQRLEAQMALNLNRSTP